jgi:hypothetical protein
MNFYKNHRGQTVFQCRWFYVVLSRRPYFVRKEKVK